MKEIKNTGTLAIVLIVTITSLILSCSKNNDDQVIQYEIPTAEKIISDFNKDNHDIIEGRLDIGHVYMRSEADNKLMLFVNNSSLQKSTLIYQLQTKELLKERFETSIEKAQVLFFKNSLIVNSLKSVEKYACCPMGYPDGCLIE